MTPSAQPTDSSPKQSLKRVLTRFDCVCIIVGTIIGAGIFKIPAVVASNVPNVYWLAAVWIFGGLIALIGALCFAELTTTYPDRGGDYGYLKRAYHHRVGFAFSWTAFWVIRPGNIGAMAMVFGTYATKAFPGILSAFMFAVCAVATITITNLLGVKAGKTVQNILTVAKVVGILLIVVAAFIFGSAANLQSGSADGNLQSNILNVNENTDSPATTNTNDVSNSNKVTDAIEVSDNDGGDREMKDGWFWLALMFVMFTFGGWNDIAFMTSEVKEPKSNLLPSLVIGTGLVLLVYLLVNFALIYGFGFDSMVAQGSMFQSATAMMINENMGEIGNRVFACLVCISCLGAINAMILTSPRIYWATALDYPALQWLAGSGSGNGWWRAMTLQAIVTLVLIGTFGIRDDGFENIVAATAPYFWLFLALTIVSLVVNRIRFKNQFDGFRIPFGPVLPAVFVMACIFMTWRALDYMFFKELEIPTLLIGGWVVVGAVISFFLKTTTKSD
ncbi:MAG: APC family permease [Mariniblastus sp.]